MSERISDSEYESKSERKHGRDSFSHSKNIIIIVFYILSLVIVAYLSYMLSARINGKKEPEVNVGYITSKLENASELTSAVLTYNGLLTYSDGNIPFITQKAFSMTYCAEIKAGIDMSRVKVQVSEDKVIVTLPEVQINNINIDPDSIQIFDEKHALFNWTDQDDVVDALSAAQTDVEEKADVEGLKTRAREQAQMVIEDLLKDSIGERTLEIN